MNHSTRRSAVLVLGCALAACDTAPDPSGPQFDRIVGDETAGRLAFFENCSACHASNDGFDLAHFHFTDTTIVRRALAHVDRSTAHDIVAYIRTIPGFRQNRDHRIFQPGGAVLGSDEEFARKLFGEDRWPEDWSSADLRSIDPRAVAIPVPLPLWSVERDNVDWMPSQPVPTRILDYDDGRPRRMLARYREDPTDRNLNLAVGALRAASTRAGPGRPICDLDHTTDSPVDFEGCFELRRWISTLSAQHVLRGADGLHLSTATQDVWWDAGQAARRSVVHGSSEIANGLENWTSWMMAGWIFRPERHSSTYMASGLVRRGMPRLAVFATLRSQVARAPGSIQPYRDLRNAIRDAPESWVTAVTAFSLRDLLERQAAGDRGDQAHREDAIESVERAHAMLAKRVDSETLRLFEERFSAVLAGLADG